MASGRIHKAEPSLGTLYYYGALQKHHDLESRSGGLGSRSSKGGGQRGRKDLQCRKHARCHVLLPGEFLAESGETWQPKPLTHHRHKQNTTKAVVVKRSKVQPRSRKPLKEDIASKFLATEEPKPCVSCPFETLIPGCRAEGLRLECTSRVTLRS